MTFLIFQDYVHNNGGLHRCLTQHYGPGNTQWVDAGDMRAGILATSKPRAFFMPGGATRYWVQPLGDAGHDAIKTYVADGGIYVGICAGAYFACAETQWRAQHEDRICVKNTLAFADVIATGPVDIYTTMRDDDLHYAAPTTVMLDTGESTQVFYWGGPLFHGTLPADATVLATYNSLPGNPVAAFTGTFGKGRYILFSYHPEIDQRQLELMRVDVAANDLGDIAAMPFLPAASWDHFYAILNRYI